MPLYYVNDTKTLSCFSPTQHIQYVVYGNINIRINKHTKNGKTNGVSALGEYIIGYHRFVEMCRMLSDTKTMVLIFDKMSTVWNTMDLTICPYPIHTFRYGCVQLLLWPLELQFHQTFWIGIGLNGTFTTHGKMAARKDVWLTEMSARSFPWRGCSNSLLWHLLAKSSFGKPLWAPL